MKAVATIAVSAIVLSVSIRADKHSLPQQALCAYGLDDFQSAMQVRCCGFDRDTQRLVTLDVLGNAIVWDPLSCGDMRVTRRFRLSASCREECTCMLLDHNMLAIGARDYVTFYDARQQDSIACAPLAKVGYDATMLHHGPIAARSLASRGNLFSVGLSTGGGVMFLDKRKMSTCVPAPVQRGRAKHTAAMAAIAACTSSQADALPPPRMCSLYHSTIAAGMLHAICHAALHLLCCRHVCQMLSRHQR